MKTIQLSMVLLFITASSGAIYAGQSVEGGDDESDCDSALVINTLWSYSSTFLDSIIKKSPLLGAVGATALAA
jgi:hypothetical protein